MKKIYTIAIIIAFSSTLSVFAGMPVLKNRIDSLNYALGVANGYSVKMYYMNDGATEEGIQSIVKGMDEAMNNNSEYYELESLGQNMGNSIKQQNETGFMGISGLAVNMEVLRQGLINGMKGYDKQMTAQEADRYLQLAMRAAEEAKSQELYADNKKAGEQFLAENATKEGVVVLPSGLQYKIIKEGKGATPTANDRVKVHYHGTVIDGTVFDSSVLRGEPAIFGVNQVIKGWTEALQLMPVGSKWIVYVPQDLAYGSTERGEMIKPYSTLIFEVELINIEK